MPGPIRRPTDMGGPPAAPDESAYQPPVSGVQSVAPQPDRQQPGGPMEPTYNVQPDSPVAGGGQQGQEGQCPSGQVWRTDSQGAYGSGRPGCEPEDWRSKQDKDTCLGARPNCGPDYDAWCDFSTATWKCGYIGKPQRPGEGDIRRDPRAGLQYNLRQGHATMVPGRSDVAYNIGRGTADAPEQCWKVPTGELIPCPRDIGALVGQGGGGRGGFGYQGGAFPATSYEQALAAQLGSLSEEFTKFASNVFGVSFPAYKQGVDYYSTLLGKGGRGAMQSAVAPAAEQIAQGTEGTLRAIGSGYLSGGAKEQAELQARLQGQGEVARLTQGVQPGAAAALVEAGGAGMDQATAGANSAAGVLGNMANLAVSSRLSGEGLELQRELGFAGIGLEGQKIDLQRDLGFAGLDLSYSQLAESASQFRQQLGLQRDMFGTEMAWNREMFGLQRQDSADARIRDTMRYRDQKKFQEKQLKAGMVNSMAQGGGQLGAAAAAKSAAKYKEDIGPAVPPSEALRRIAEEAAPALRRWKYRQDVPDLDLAGRAYDNALVLDLAPRYGKYPTADAPGGRVVDFLALLGDLVGAVRALRDENRGLLERLERAERALPPGEGR